MLIANRRLRSVDSAAEMQELVLNAGVSELPLTGDIAIIAGELENLRGDPADHFIVATAIAYEATLLTADATLLRWRHKLRRHDAKK